MLSVLEIGVEEELYSLSLWWEIRPSLRNALVDSRETTGRTRGEVRGDDTSRIGPHVVEEVGIAWLKALHLSTNRTGG